MLYTEQRSGHETRPSHWLCRGDHAGVCGLHTADVLPNLHLRGLHGRSDHGGGEVGAVPAQRGDDASGILQGTRSEVQQECARGSGIRVALLLRRSALLGNVAGDNGHESIVQLQRAEVMLDGLSCYN